MKNKEATENSNHETAIYLNLGTILKITLCCILIITILFCTSQIQAQLTIGFSDSSELVINFDDLANRKGWIVVEIYNRNNTPTDINLCIN